VASFNLWSGRALLDGGRPAPRPDTGALARSAEVLRDLEVDVLAVQEVDRGQERSSGADQLQVVAEAFGAVAWRFAPTVTGVPGPARGWQPVTHTAATAGSSATPDGPSYGVGLVSRLPVLAWRVRRFPASRAVLPMAVPGLDGRPRLLLVPDEPRAAVAAVVDAPGGPVTVVSAHLSFAPPVSLRQLRALRRWVRSLPAPVVVAGDLNLPGTLPARLTGWAPLADGATYPAAAPRMQLDHLLLAQRDGVGPHGGVSASDRHAAHQEARATLSDHLPLVAQLGTDG